MAARTITWDTGMQSLGPAVVAIGVFDGVHIGHQGLLRDAVAHARARGVQAIAVTFDRDPDQVVSPQTAAPQLLTLADKTAFIAETGVDAVLIVPFDDRMAHVSPESFVSDVLLRAVTPVAVHVGGDFRFGHMAMGDVFTLQREAATRGFEVCPQDLLSVDGSPVTSTRIRSLVASGNVAEASALLGRATRVAGSVHHGRGEGATFGFPTANVVPVPFAALPADGVYAGRALLADGSEWASAISVGTPPMFPEARDYLEAHLIGFDGDLYDQEVTLTFIERLRGLGTFASLDALKAAISDDVTRALDIAGFSDEELGSDAENPASGDVDDDGEPIVEDPDALEAAERAAQNGGPDRFEDLAIGEFKRLLVMIDRSAISAGAQAFTLVAPLEAANIPYVWDPYPPEDRPTGLPGGGTFEQPFTLLVPESMFAAAREALRVSRAEDAFDGEPYREDRFDTDNVVFDPAALDAAEQAVRDESAEQPEGEWLLVLSGLPHDKTRLAGIESALEAAGIASYWEPYPPSQAPLLHLNLFGQDRFDVQVPAEEFDHAAEVLSALGEDAHDRRSDT